MTVEEFVRTTIVEVARGVRGAQLDVETDGNGARVNPIMTGRAHKVCEVECDIGHLLRGENAIRDSYELAQVLKP